MATLAASKVALRSTAGTYDHVFFSGMAILMAITVFVGFAPSYYLAAFGDRPMVTPFGGVPFTPLLHLHGVLFTAFVVLFVVQTTLVASHRVAVHRQLGVAGGLLAVVMTLVGTATGITSVSGGSAPPELEPVILLGALFEMLLFAIFVGAALWLRANKAAHKRLMLLAYISIISAAIVRLPGVRSDFFGDDLALLFLLAGIVYDLVTQQRVHPAYVGGGALLVLSVLLQLMVSRTETWRAVAEWLTR